MQTPSTVTHTCDSIIIIAPLLLVTSSLKYSRFTGAGTEWNRRGWRHVRLQGTYDRTNASSQVVHVRESESPFSWLRHHQSLPGEGEKCSSLALKEFFKCWRVNINCFWKCWRLPCRTPILKYKERYFKSLAAALTEATCIWRRTRGDKGRSPTLLEG
jgi:hypothetical protein